MPSYPLQVHRATAGLRSDPNKERSHLATAKRRFLIAEPQARYLSLLNSMARIRQAAVAVVVVSFSCKLLGGPGRRDRDTFQASTSPTPCMAAFGRTLQTGGFSDGDLQLPVL
jgi:hypothetical protein